MQFRCGVCDELFLSGKYCGYVCLATRVRKIKNCCYESCSAVSSYTELNEFNQRVSYKTKYVLRNRIENVLILLPEIYVDT